MRRNAIETSPVWVVVLRNNDCGQGGVWTEVVCAVDHKPTEAEAEELYLASVATAERNAGSMDADEIRQAVDEARESLHEDDPIQSLEICEVPMVVRR